MTNVVSTPRAAEFLATAGDFLRTRPVEHSVLLTNAAGRVDDAGTDNLWAWVRAADDRVVAVVMHTPPFGACVSLGPDDAVAALAGALHERDRRLPGVRGRTREADAFAAEWVRRTGATVETVMRQGMYVVDEVRAPNGVSGRIRLADPADLGLLRDWVAGFHTDTHLPAEPSSDLPERVAAGRLWLWVVDDRPVAMAGMSPAVGGVSRVQYVYTPPRLRGHGYASACVAAVTARELAEPGRRCMLYTDLANPTSNGIYQALGYRRIGEDVQLAFG